MEQSDLFAAIVEHSDAAIISTNLDGQVLSWNCAAEQIFSWTAEEMIGQPLRRIIPADRQAEEDHNLDQIKLGESVTRLETVRLRKDEPNADPLATPPAGWANAMKGGLFTVPRLGELDRGDDE